MTSDGARAGAFGASEPSKGRVIAFRVIAGIGGALAVVFTVPFTIAVVFSSGPDSIHRIHVISGAVGFGLLSGVVLLLCAWRPAEFVSAFQVAIAATVAVLVAGLLSGDLLAAGYGVQVVIVAVLVVLHPARGRVLHARAPSVPLAVLSVAALVPSIGYLLTWSAMQRDAVAGDPHAAMHHYSGMAALGIGISLAGSAVSLRASGWRAMAWFVGVSWAAMALASLAWPDYVSAFDALWAWAALAYGIVFIAVAEWEARTPDGMPGIEVAR